MILLVSDTPRIEQARSAARLKRSTDCPVACPSLGRILLLICSIAALTQY